MKKIFMMIFILSSVFLLAGEHGMYLLTNQNVKGNISDISRQISEKLSTENYQVFFADKIATPDIIRKDENKKCGFKAGLIIFSSDDYVKKITSYGNKYLTAAFLRIGFYENEDGIQIIISDPETVNRIIFNDLPDKKYEEIISFSQKYKTNILELLHSMNLGKNIEETRKPIRSDKDLRKAAKDMMMMVGPMTFFKNEDQFKEIYSQESKNGKVDLQNLCHDIRNNIKNFSPAEEDKKYYFFQSAENLKWKVVGEIWSPDSTSVLLGILRDRTTALSFHIAGMKRETENNKCPGIDHVCAYPIEVLISLQNGKIIVQTPREMFRMDMYFWDAGKWAFMKFMNMPKMLDNSIYRALFGK
ncbi:MAG: hypothetical protein DRZ79_06445 [Candidatus Cloacimonadota bacterium]|nr:MAG: hypothetical protein DRZ79_06445 [Candidatus Cloacimonadota bacterium]